MNEDKYMLPERREILPDVTLLPRNFGKRKILFAKFGPDFYTTNLEKMRKHYWNSKKFPDVTFEPASTPESICLFAQDEYLQHSFWLQAGMILREKDGVYINPLRALVRGNISDLILHQLRDKAQSVRGIRLGKNNFAYVPYETFREGEQEAKEFAESGLARGLECTKGKIAPTLYGLASSLRYNTLVVSGFDEPEVFVPSEISLTFVGRLCVISGCAGRKGVSFGKIIKSGYSIYDK